MSFGAPIALVALAIVPLAAFAYSAFRRARTSFAERFSTPAMLPNVIDREPGWRRHLPVAILLAGLAVLIMGVARPKAMVTAKRENATVVLALDTSRSMAAADVRPSRLEAVRTAAFRFLGELPRKYRVGVVSFSTTAEVLAPATRERAVVTAAISQLEPNGGTALGDGIVEALHVGRAVPREPGAGGRPAVVPPVSVLVFTDGIQEGGEVSAAAAVSNARRLKIPVSAVLVGTPYGFIRIPRVGGFTQFIRVPADASELRGIAKATGGGFYVGPRTADLSGVYRELGSRLGTTRKREEISFAFAIGGVALLLVGGSLSAVWLRRLP